jgi:phosphoglycolate phosphatase
LLELAPQDCIYVGDDLRDMLAAHAAGMRSVAVAWGYGDALESWNADRIIRHPAELIPAL